jgi:hypothetical protein
VNDTGDGEEEESRVQEGRPETLSEQFVINRHFARGDEQDDDDDDSSDGDEEECDMGKIRQEERRNRGNDCVCLKRMCNSCP